MLGRGGCFFQERMVGGVYMAGVCMAGGACVAGGHAWEGGMHGRGVPCDLSHNAFDVTCKLTPTESQQLYSCLCI